MPRVAYVISEELIKQCDKIPVLKKRASMVHELIRAYNLHRLMDCVKPNVASDENLSLFHSQYYLDYLKNECTAELSFESVGSDDDDDAEDSDTSDVDDEQLNYGLGYDCPKIFNLWKFVRVIAGASVTAANLLLSNRRIVINWCGGWHHAQRDEAEGFCYVNDIAIAIQRLRTRFQRILYIDLDVHHGNGVENAFAYTRRVFTVSFHQFQPGFFPGTGNVDDCGHGIGKGYCVNFPYKSHIRGELFIKYFYKTLTEILNKYQPDACVVQCGADSIVSDPLGGTNLLPEDLAICVERILSWDLPTIFLGGGGYNFQNAARYWTTLTSIICKTREPLDNDLPDNEYFLRYGPGYELSIPRKQLDDLNTENDMETTYQTIIENLKKYNVFNC
ncbi:histone deacetylase 8-like [Sitodiplosis mosellana]|uniref:histone deacetylase 8-like n=1 Tax=Sitodiplosis mosellana TaxID=263140 RepID=UPI002445371C|nr:histone deacetylase 8-like [Sitodiplosis mosellana]